MKVHEYQAKKFFAIYGLPVDRNIICRTPDEAVEAYKQLGIEKAVVKAQVHTGGRGKAGGVKLGSNEAEIRQHAEAILGMDIKGFIVDRVLVSEAVDIASEYYMSILVDRKSKCPMLMLSRAGGMDIEQVAKETPEKIEKIVIDPVTGMSDYLAREAAFKLFDDMAQVKQAVPIFKNIYKLFTEKDASLAEINPLVMLKDGSLKAIDAKMTFDDNALFRHPDVAELFEPTEEERKERNAKEKGFSYVNLGGSIGCMVNGAGLAMATMDMIKLYGGEPANFLDIGGSSNPEKIVEAMKLLLSDKHVKVVLINIFGGITRCDDVANGLLEAFKVIETDIPIVIRLTGTNEAEGRAILEGTHFNKDTKLIVQGITGRDGSFHASKMKEYGTNVVGGTSPGKAGQEVCGIPVFNTVKDAVAATGANASIIFVPAPFAKDAMLEAIDGGVKLVICITEGVPTLDAVAAQRYAKIKGVKVIGPNCPGLISPEESMAGIMPTNIFKKGHTGVISRSGTLTYEVVYNLTQAGLGQSTAVGVGGDPVVGLYFEELLRMFQDDPETDSIALIGEIGGDAEERAAKFIKEHVTKPVAVFISGQQAPPGKQMGHAGAIISSGSGSASEKIAAFEAVGVPVARETSEIPELLKKRLNK